jgi:hypothetical protein
VGKDNVPFFQPTRCLLREEEEKQRKNFFFEQHQNRDDSFGIIE